jgi:hypothetical protein
LPPRSLCSVLSQKKRLSVNLKAIARHFPPDCVLLCQPIIDK